MIRVLIVDDSTLTHHFLEEALGQQDFIICGHAYNGMDGIRAYLELAPDVVVMDMMMPQMDGVESTRQIRALDPDARVVMLTSIDRTTLLEAAIEAGARDYALKPCDPTELAQTLRRAVTGRMSHSEQQVRLSQAFIEVFGDVLSEFDVKMVHALGGGPWVRRIHEPLICRVGFSGRYEGHINYFFERRFANTIVATSFPDDDVDETLELDAVSEIANIVTGHIARFMESFHGKFEFHPPELVKNQELISRIPPICKVSTNAGQIEVALTRLDQFSTV